MNLFASLLLVAASAFAQSDGGEAEVEWSVDYAKAFAAAKTSKKPLLVVIEDSSKGTDKFEEEKLAADQTQLELLNQFELCKIDVSSNTGKKVAKAFGATELPYTAITDRTNSIVVYRRAGKMSRNEWISALIDNKDRVYARKPVLPAQPTAATTGTIQSQAQYTKPQYAQPAVQQFYQAPAQAQNYSWTYPSQQFFSPAHCST